MHKYQSSFVIVKSLSSYHKSTTLQPLASYAYYSLPKMIKFLYTLLYVSGPFVLPVWAGCDADNCLRAMDRSSVAASSFCLTYTKAVHTSTIDLPTFVSACSFSASRLSSACSCFQPGSTSSVKLTSTKTTSSSKSTGSPESTSIKSTSTMPISSSGLSSTSTAPSITESVTTYKPTICPQTTPSVSFAFAPNSTLSTQLNESFSLYSSDETTILAFDINDTTVYIDLSDSGISAFAPDGRFRFVKNSLFLLSGYCPSTS
jgi:hypothetical protein